MASAAIGQRPAGSYDAIPGVRILRSPQPGRNQLLQRLRHRAAPQALPDLRCGCRGQGAALPCLQGRVSRAADDQCRYSLGRSQCTARRRRPGDGEGRFACVDGSVAGPRGRGGGIVDNDPSFRSDPAPDRESKHPRAVAAFRDRTGPAPDPARTAPPSCRARFAQSRQPADAQPDGRGRHAGRTVPGARRSGADVAREARRAHPALRPRGVHHLPRSGCGGCPHLFGRICRRELVRRQSRGCVSAQTSAAGGNDAPGRGRRTRRCPGTRDGSRGFGPWRLEGESRSGCRHAAREGCETGS